MEEIDLLQQKLNERTDKLNGMKSRRDELNRTLDDTETHLKQVNGNLPNNPLICTLTFCCC